MLWYLEWYGNNVPGVPPLLQNTGPQGIEGPAEPYQEYAPGGGNNDGLLPPNYANVRASWTLVKGGSTTEGRFPALRYVNLSSLDGQMTAANGWYAFLTLSGNSLGQVSVSVPVSGASNHDMARNAFVNNADLQAAATAQWWGYMGYPNGPGMTVEEALRTDPAAQDFAREVALPNYLRDRIPTTATDPNTFPTPWLVVSITATGSRPITWLMWMEDCYADTNADTDGDGMPDWIECRLASDPDNGGERPNLNGDPDGDGYTNE